LPQATTTTSTTVSGIRPPLARRNHGRKLGACIRPLAVDVCPSARLHQRALPVCRSGVNKGRLPAAGQHHPVTTSLDLELPRYRRGTRAVAGGRTAADVMRPRRAAGHRPAAAAAAASSRAARPGGGNPGDVWAIPSPDPHVGPKQSRCDGLPAQVAHRCVAAGCPTRRYGVRPAHRPTGRHDSHKLGRRFIGWELAFTADTSTSTCIGTDPGEALPGSRSAERGDPRRARWGSDARWRAPQRHDHPTMILKKLRRP
jgi:hypothetical protein